MRSPSLWVLLIVTCTPICGAAAEKEFFYYLGEVKNSSPDGKPLPSQVILLVKTHDPDKSEITESAVVVKPDGSSERYTMHLTVTGSDFTIADDAHTVSGSGKLFGPTWAWTYFKGTFKSTNGVAIEDENFLADPSVGVARKKVIAPDGKVILYMDVTLKSVTPETYKILANALVKK